MKKLNKKGFTLIELLAVIVILAIVAAVSMTIIVPMINGQTGKGAETSVKELNKAIANSCTATGVNNTYGTFDPSTYYTEDNATKVLTEITDAGDKATARANCATSTGCYVEMTADDIKDVNVAGDMPTKTRMYIKSCQVVDSCVHYTTGSFANVRVVTANGVTTATEDINAATTCDKLAG